MMRALRGPVYFLACLFMFQSPLFAKSKEVEQVKKHITDFNIETAVLTSFENNRSIQEQKTNLKKAYANKLYAISNFLPKAEVGYSYTHNDALYTIAAPANAEIDPRTFIGYENDNLFSISVEQDIFKGGAHVATFKQSALELISQREVYRATILETEYETKRLFYGLLLAYEIERIARDLVTQAEAHYKEVQSKYGQGTASKFDLLQSKVQVAEVIPQLVRAESSIQLILVEFKKLLTLNLRERITINGKLEFDHIEISEDAFLAEALVRRPEMIIRNLDVDIEKWGIELAKATGVPQVTGNFEYFGRSNNIGTMLRKQRETWYIGLKAVIPVFDGLATPAKIDEARARYADAKLSKDDYKDQIAVDIKKTCLDLVEAETIIAAQKDSVVEAREALRLSEVRYNTGVGINLDVLDSQVALAQVEQSLAEAMYDYIMAKANLNRIMGREFSKEIK